MLAPSSCASLMYMRTRALNHSVYRLQYHIVWGTRFRRKYIKSYVRREILYCFNQAKKDYPTLHFETVNTGEDHVHLQIEIPPNITIAAVVQALKARSSILLKKKFKFIREMYLDGSIWSVGYFVSSVGLDEAAIKRYIQYQEKKDKGSNLRLGFS